ncbi:NADase-type glycan-binding domain-containing protein [Streptomyces sp. NPDC018045]|uniref:NADase-type glycan-binding domain-containing protein n=1 Tax=Streptomyces sp. NPDC018045 TaxID=3365037 RepID=UPI0037906462
MSTPDCGECGTRAEPGQSFCDACGAVLRWDAAGGRTGAPAPSDAGSARAAARPDGAGPARRANGPRNAAPAPTTAQGTRTDPHGAGVPAAPSALSGHRPSGAAPEHPGERDGARAAGATRSAPGPTSGAPDQEDTDPSIPLPARQDGFTAGSTTADRARSLVVPVPEQEAALAAPAPAVAPVLPGRPDTDRPHVRVPGPQRTGHGPPCTWCATPNHPDRHFCGHCAMPLTESGAPAAPGHRPWWRRLFGPGGEETPWAGDRPRLRRAFDRVGTWVTLAVTVTLIILGVLYLPDGIQATRDHFAKRAPVEPDQIRASRSYPGHGPKLVFDKLNNTWWGPGVEQSGQGEWIEVRFARPARLLDVIITPGVSTRADQLDKSALPHRVKATVTTADGQTVTRELTLDPGAGGQRRAFRVGAATKVRFTVESAHAASAGKQVAIAEIELFGRSGEDRS